VVFDINHAPESVDDVLQQVVVPPPPLEQHELSGKCSARFGQGIEVPIAVEVSERAGTGIQVGDRSESWAFGTKVHEVPGGGSVETVIARIRELIDTVVVVVDNERGRVWRKGIHRV